MPDLAASLRGAVQCRNNSFRLPIEPEPNPSAPRATRAPLSCEKPMLNSITNWIMRRIGPFGTELGVRYQGTMDDGRWTMDNGPGTVATGHWSLVTGHW